MRDQWGDEPINLVCNRLMRPRGLHALLGGAAIAAVASFSGLAYGQSASVAPASTVSTEDGSPSGQISEVVVSARKRNESVIDVPQTVTSFSSKTLTDYNIQSFADYGNKIPNLVFSQGESGGGYATSRGVTIRGVEGANTTAFYIDDVPVPASLDPRAVDLARIEVLKGPQGTLFGAASIGGNVRFITNQPSFAGDTLAYQLQGGGTSHAGSPDYGASVITNDVVVPDKLAVRAMAFYNHDSGYVTRTYPDPDSLTKRDSVSNQGEEFEYGGSFTALGELTDDLSITARLIFQKEQYPNGWPVVYRGLSSFTPSTDTIDRVANVQDFSTHRWYTPSLTLNYKGPGFSVVSTVSYYDDKSRDGEDTTEGMTQALYERYGFVSNQPQITIEDNQQEQVTHETRVNINPIYGFSGVLGYYYSQNNAKAYVEPRYVNGFAAAGLATTDSYFYLRSWPHLTNRALFGELYYSPIKQVTFTAGLRHFIIDQHTPQFLEGFAVGSDAGFATYSQSHESGYVPKFSVKYEPERDMSFYASAAKGFRPGGAGTSLFSACSGDLAAIGLTFAKVADGYTSDSVWSYEVGAKKSFFNDRALVTAAVFHTDWSGIQQNVTLPTCGVSFTTNAGAAKINGGELELNGQITHDLSVRIGYGYTSAEITEAGASGQQPGSPVYNVPKANGTVGFVYNHPVTATLNGYLSGDWSYTGGSFSNNGSATYPQYRPSYQITNARAGLKFGADELSVYVNNIFNVRAVYGELQPEGLSESITINGIVQPYTRVPLSRPVQVGVQFKHGF